MAKTAALTAVLATLTIGAALAAGRRGVDALGYELGEPGVRRGK